MKFNKPLLFILLLPIYSKSQEIIYPEETIISHKIKTIIEYKITGFVEQKPDTSIYRRLVFDTLGRVVMKEEDFNMKDSPQIVYLFKYEYLSAKYQATEKIISTKTVKYPAVEEAYLKSSPIFTIQKFSNRGNLTVLESFGEFGYTSSINFTYDDSNLLRVKEEYNNHVLREKIFYKYINFSGGIIK